MNTSIVYAVSILVLIGVYLYGRSVGLDYPHLKPGAQCALRYIKIIFVPIGLLAIFGVAPYVLETAATAMPGITLSHNARPPSTLLWLALAVMLVHSIWDTGLNAGLRAVNADLWKATSRKNDDDHP